MENTWLCPRATELSFKTKVALLTQFMKRSFRREVIQSLATTSQGILNLRVLFINNWMAETRGEWLVSMQVNPEILLVHSMLALMLTTELAKTIPYSQRCFLKPSPIRGARLITVLKNLEHNPVLQEREFRLRLVKAQFSLKIDRILELALLSMLPLTITTYPKVNRLMPSTESFRKRS